MMSGDRERAIRTGWEVNVSAAFAADEDAWRRFAAIAERRAVAVAGGDGPDAGDRSTRHERAPARPGDAHARDPRHGRSDASRRATVGIVASLIPGAQLEILDGVGHLFFWEQPERSAELVRAHAAVRA